MKADEIELQQTCSACPEQYDAYYKGSQVGYLRMRWGVFWVFCPYSDGEVVLSAKVSDNPYLGAFHDADRESWLQKAKEAIVKWHLVVQPKESATE